MKLNNKYFNTCDYYRSEFDQSKLYSLCKNFADHCVFNPKQYHSDNQSTPVIIPMRAALSALKPGNNYVLATLPSGSTII